MELEWCESRGFLDRTYRTEPRLAHFDSFRLLNESCEVRFGYGHPTIVEADVCSSETEEYLILGWAGGVWEITGPRRV